MLEFAKYLKENFKEDVSSAEKIIQTKWNKVVAIIKEAFDGLYSDKKTALYRIQNEFVDPKVAPKSIDVDFLKNNMNYVMDKVNSLDEGEIRIIINNDVQKGSAGASVTGMETEGKKGKKKDVVKEEMDEIEPTDEISGEISGEIGGMGGSVGGEEDEKIVKVSVEDNKVTVEPSENTGLERSEHEFEDEEAASAFVASLENLFKGFKIEKAEAELVDGDEAGEIEGAAEEETEEESVKIKKRLVLEAEEGEEPEDAGEEPEDAGEEPEDAGEEPEDAGEIDWEDIADGEGEEEGDAEECIVAPVRSIGSMERPELESLDLNKLINTLVRVEDKWYKVNSITENNEVICIDKEGKENYFDLEQIEEMEQTLDELAKSAVDPNAGEEEVEKPEESEEEFEPADAEECVPCKKGKECAEEEIGLAGALSPEQMAELKAWIANPEEDPSDELYQTLMDYYADEMPYGTQKARDGDPYEWLLAKTSAELGGAEEPVEPAEKESEPAEAEEETQEESLSRKSYIPDNVKIKKSKYSGGDRYWAIFKDDDWDEKGIVMGSGNNPWEAINDLRQNDKNRKLRNKSTDESLSFAKLANRYMDLEEDALSSPSMLNTQSGGLTSKPGVINQTITPIKSAPKAATVKGPTSALTAKPSKPGEKLEKVPSAPTAPAKKGPQQTLTSKPKAPPKKVEKVKAAPKMATKAAPKGSFTAKPGKTGQKVEKIKAPVTPTEYKKGGFKG